MGYHTINPKLIKIMTLAINRVAKLCMHNKTMTLLLIYEIYRLAKKLCGVFCMEPMAGIVNCFNMRTGKVSYDGVAVRRDYVL